MDFQQVHTLTMLSLMTRHSFRRSPYEVPSLHIDGHLVLDEIDAESVGLMVSNRSSTPTSISDWHMVLDEIDTTHDNPLTRTLNNDDSLSEEIISKYLKPSRLMSSDKNVLCSICQESFKDDEKKQQR
ncbi:hypothetical protein ZOSMA_90G00150 [Zostera marina]|uniref:Uncharacterized protein n=1 Tax=Zostera marina TaxID=29655 RepID=A0A0K9NLI4_ZOSMR|nr:hypothetical protein ZOSMA_90G00150 [Zostera marina]